MARTKIQGYVEQGGNTVNTASFISTTKVQDSFPFATVTVYLTGTTTLATLYSNSGGTAKANPFTASADGYFFFYVDDGTYDIQFSSNASSPSFTTFSWAAITVGGGGVGYNVTSFGAVGDGVTDDTAAIQAAMSVTGAHSVIFPSGTYLVTDSILIAQDGIQVIGEGERSTIILFVPTAHDKSAFKFSIPATSINQCSISGFSFKSTNTTFRKFMIEVVDGRQVEISHISSIDTEWSDASFLCEGIRTKGRELIHLHDATIYADIPLHIMANPNFATLEADHSWFGPALILAPHVGNPAIKVDAAVVFSNTTFDGIAFVRGGFSWAGTNATASYNIIFRQIRMEQEATGTWTIDMNGTTVVQELTINCVRGGAGIASARDGKGIRLRNCYLPTLIDYRYLGISTTLDIDATVYNFTGINCAWGATSDGVTASISGQTLIHADGSFNVTSPIASPNVKYQSTNVSTIELQELGTKRRIFLGQLANNGQLNLAAAGFSGTGAETVIGIIVHAVNVTTGNPVGGTVTVSMTGTHGVSQSADANFAYGNVPGKLSILWQNNSNIALLNQLGAAVNYMVEMRWY